MQQIVGHNMVSTIRCLSNTQEFAAMWNEANPDNPIVLETTREAQ
jgi:hypothetical protein